MKISLIIASMILSISIAIILFNLKTTDDKNSLLNGSWVADGTQHVFVIGYEDNKPVLSDKDGLSPFYLIFDKKDEYSLTMNNYTERGTYSLNENDEVVLTANNGLITEQCQLKNKNELHCNKYASLYIKEH